MHTQTRVVSTHTPTLINFFRQFYCCFTLMLIVTRRIIHHTQLMVCLCGHIITWQLSPTNPLNKKNHVAETSGIVVRIFIHRFTFTSAQSGADIYIFYLHYCLIKLQLQNGVNSSSDWDKPGPNMNSLFPYSEVRHLWCMTLVAHLLGGHRQTDSSQQLGSVVLLLKCYSEAAEGSSGDSVGMNFYTRCGQSVWLWLILVWTLMQTPLLKKKKTLNYHITSGVEVVFLKSVGSDGFLDEASAA